MGTAFMVLLPEAMEWLSVRLRGRPMEQDPRRHGGVAFLKQVAIGLAIVLFLIFEPDGLAHRWRLIKAYWRLYPFSH